MNKLILKHRLEKAVREISEGNTGALADIYELAGRQMFAIAYSILGDYHLSEDVVSESLISILDHAKNLRKQSSAYSWIMNIVHNAALNMIRSRSYELFPGEFLESATERDELGLSVTSLALWEALKTLDEDDRQIVLLKAVMGFSHKEISEIVGVSLSACQKRYQRSIAKLGELMQMG